MYLVKQLAAICHNGDIIAHMFKKINSAVLAILDGMYYHRATRSIQGSMEQEPTIPPSFEVIQETARNNANGPQESHGERGIGHLLQRVKDGLKDAAKNLVGDSAENVRDYLPESHQDHVIVMGYIKTLNKKFKDNPDLKREGWEEIWLPQAVEGQGGRITRAQANRVIATIGFRSGHNG